MDRITATIYASGSLIDFLGMTPSFGVSATT
jgi:hypothetical protein